MRIHPNAKILIIQALDASDIEVLDKEIALIEERVDIPFHYVGYLVKNWQDEMSPWEMAPIFGKVPFGGKAKEVISELEKDLFVTLKNELEYETCILSGYSLAGLFALYAGYETKSFDGIVAVSPSVWFDDWDKYIDIHKLKADYIYLSLGNKEEKTKNPIMAKVKERIILQEEKLRNNHDVILKWNEGNHFMDVEKRMASGLIWALKKVEKKMVE